MSRVKQDDIVLRYLLREHEFEQQVPNVGWQFYKGVGIGLLLMAVMLGACWVIVSWLR